MKKYILFLMIVSLFGCDNKNDKENKLTIAAMIATGREEKTTQCEKGNVTLKCEFLSEDLLESGKWHHGIVFISNSGDVDVTVDNMSYYQTKANSTFSDGDKNAFFYFKGLNDSKAQVSIVDSNRGTRITLNVWNSKGDKYITASN
ncbi:TPA: hypothetical protein R4057_001955 [Kluyvera ascorbata]|nr:hypothetical protein [Kluyvera ascorbata]